MFRALADPTRRMLLDRLRERPGQTLGELCAPLAMARQSATDHLRVLEAANLVSTVRHGREKLHYLNPVPLWNMQERWMARFEAPRLQALSAVKRQAEEKSVTDRPAYVYVTYIESTPERVWDALTDADLTAQFWGHANVSDWEAGSPWQHVRVDGSDVADVVGTVLAAERPRLLTITFASPDQESPEEPSVVTFTIEPFHAIAKLTVMHAKLRDDQAWQAISLGWPAVCANLKSLLETGRVLSSPPWEMG